METWRDGLREGRKSGKLSPVFLDLLRGEETECLTLKMKKPDRRCRVL